MEKMYTLRLPVEDIKCLKKILYFYGEYLNPPWGQCHPDQNIWVFKTKEQLEKIRNIIIYIHNEEDYIPKLSSNDISDLKKILDSYLQYFSGPGCIYYPERDKWIKKITFLSEAVSSAYYYPAVEL